MCCVDAVIGLSMHDDELIDINLNRPTRRGKKSREGKEVPILGQGHRVGAAHAPARTHNGPTLASSLIPNSLNGCKRQVRGKPNRTESLAGSHESSFRKSTFYGQVNPMAHS